MKVPDSIIELLDMESNRDAYEEWELRRAAVYALNDIKTDADIDWLDKVRKDKDWRVRFAAVKCFSGRIVPFNWVQDALEDDIPNVRCMAVEYMTKTDNILPSMIHMAVYDESWVVREAAVYLCKAKINSIPEEWVLHLKNDEEEYIRKIANVVLK